MALDTDSEGNFSARNPEEVVRLTENFASSNSNKNWFQKEEIGTVFGKEQMYEIKAKLDSVHKLLKKQFSFLEDVEAVDVDNDKGDEEDVNFISGIGFQNHRSGNQSGNINFHSNGQRGNYNQSSQYQKSYCNNYNNNNTTFGSSSYQNPPLETQENKIEGAWSGSWESVEVDSGL